MDDWLEQARARIAETASVDISALSLSEEHAVAVLDLARSAAHESGDRTNAPLVCPLVALAAGRNAEVDPAVLVRSVRG